MKPRLPLLVLALCLGTASVGAQPRRGPPRPQGSGGRAAPRQATSPRPATPAPSTAPTDSPIMRITRLFRLAVAEADAGSCESARLAREVCSTILAYAEDVCRISVGVVTLGGGGAEEGAVFSGPEPVPLPPALGTAIRFCGGVLRAAGVTPSAAAACGPLTGGGGDAFAIARVATGPITIASAVAHYEEGLRRCESTGAEPSSPLPAVAPNLSEGSPRRQQGPAPSAGTARRFSIGFDLGAVLPVVPDLYDRLYGPVCVLDLGARVSAARWRWEAHVMALGAIAEKTTFNGAEQRQDLYGFGVRAAALVAISSRSPWEVQLGPEVGYMFLQREFARQDLPAPVPERQHGHHLLLGAVVGVERRLWPSVPTSGRSVSVTLDVAADYVLLSLNDELTHSAQVRLTGGVRYEL